MSKAEKWIMYPKTSSFKDDELLCEDEYNYDGKKETFTEIRNNVKNSVILKGLCALEDCNKVLEYFEKNFDYFLLSHVASIIIKRHGMTLCKIVNTSKPVNDKSRSIVAECSKELIEAIIDKKNSSNFGYYLGAGILLLILYRYKYI
jgi:hypothetical protein